MSGKNGHGKNTDKEATQARRALWASCVFYVLVAFEFFYMASPFAAYFYAVYGPGLDGLQASGPTSWTIQFFMPHLVEETRSVLIDVHESIGRVLLFGGLAGFAFGVIQIYRAKLRRDDAVMGGLYRHIRHPQYLALIAASIGMLLIWPRYLVLVLTVTVIFIYIALAKAEEGICLRKFPGYSEYMKRTGMFLPGWFSLNRSLRFGDSRLKRFAGWGLTYVFVLGLALLVALGLRAYSMNALHTYQGSEGVYLSVVEISDADLASVAAIAGSAPEVQAALSGKEHLLNYVVPTEMFISEIPMYLPPGEEFGHSVPADRNPALYKVIFTEAVFGGDGLPAGGDILWEAVNKVPLVEAHMDLNTREVTATFPPPAEPFYGNRQVPLF